MGSGASVTSKPTCEFCSSQLLTIFSRKKCAKCPKTVCSKCLRSPDAVISLRQLKLCPKCLLLGSGNFTRRDLDPYTSKELRHFLVQKHISTEGCREKNDLVELVLRTSSCVGPLNQEELEHSRHIELLRERLRDVNSEEVTDLSSVTDRHGSSHRSLSEQSESVPRSGSRTSSQPGEATQGISSSRDASPRDGHQEHSSEAQEQMSNSTNQTPQDLQTAQRRGVTLDEIECESDLETLTVRQLKELLVRNYVDYKGCCEKPELLDRVRRLWRQHRSKPEGADIDQVPSDDLCKICMDAVIDCVLLECGHMSTCTNCGKRLAECPLCRCYVSRVVHVFRS